MTKSRTIATALPAAIGLLLIAGEAAAHHPMDGAMPTTFVEGFLSGIGHPVLGLDHLAAVVAAGLIAATLRNGAAMVTAYVLAMLGGAALHAAGFDLPAGEILAAIAVIALGAVLIAGSAVGFPVALGMFAIAGLIHGHVLGETIVGAEPAPIGAYFIGLALVQAAIALGVMMLARAALRSASAASPALRAAGAAVAVIGVWFLVQNIAVA